MMDVLIYLPSTKSVLGCIVVAVLGLIGVVGWYIYSELTLSFRNLKGPAPAHWLYGDLPALQISPHGMLQTRWFNKYGSTLRYYSTNRTPLILTCDPTLVNHINTHPTEFEQPEFVFAFSRENMGPSLTASANADHRRQRRAIAPSFATPQLNVMTPLLLTKAFQLVEKIIEEVKERGEGREVEWVMFIQRLTVDVIGLAGFDLDFDTLGKGGSELLDAWRRQLGGGGDGRFVMLLQSWGVRVPMFLRNSRAKGIDESSRMMKAMGQELLASRRQTIRTELGSSTTKQDFKSNDLITNLLRANMAVDTKDDQRMSDAEVLAQIPLFLFAGNTTIAVTLTWAVGILARRPDIQDKLRDDVTSITDDDPSWNQIDSLPYLEAFVQELLRVYPAAPTMFRVAQVDTIVPLGKSVKGRDGKMIDRLHVKKGTQFHVDLGRMNLSAEIFGPGAEVFNPERFMVDEKEKARLVGLNTFGGGARHCIGWKFAIAEIKCCLFAILRRLTLEDTGDRPTIERFGGLGLVRPKVAGKMEMPLVVRPLDI